MTPLVIADSHGSAILEVMDRPRYDIAPFVVFRIE